MYILFCTAHQPLSAPFTSTSAPKHDRGLVPAVLPALRSDPLRSDRIYAYPRKAGRKRLDRRIFPLRYVPLSRSFCGQATHGVIIRSQIANELIASIRKESRLHTRVPLLMLHLRIPALPHILCENSLAQSIQRVDSLARGCNSGDKPDPVATLQAQKLCSEAFQTLY